MLRDLSRLTIGMAEEQLEEQLEESSQHDKARTTQHLLVHPRVAAHHVSTIHASHQEVLSRWASLHQFVHKSEDGLGLVQPVSCGCGKVSFLDLEKHLLGTAAGLTSLAFAGLLFAVRYYGGLEDPEADGAELGPGDGSGSWRIFRV